MLEVASLHEVPLQRGTQTLPDFSRPGSAAGLPIMKERAQLQVRACLGSWVPCSPLHASACSARAFGKEERGSVVFWRIGHGVWISGITITVKHGDVRAGKWGGAVCE